MINQEQERWTQFIRNRALELGFDAIDLLKQLI